MATNGSFAQQEQYKAPSEPTSVGTIDPSSASGTNNNDLTKDQIGWIFIEQYYTTLSKSPERLHLFYHKRSQFVAGVEAELANVSVGRQAIQERIKALDFQDTKVRVSNVDSQASFDSIVIQVIGEVSNNAGEPKKFVQTFVLAQQPTGYFVLNDILRYIDEEGEDEAAEAPEGDAEEAEVEVEPEAEPAKPEEPAAEEPAALDAKAVEQKLEEEAAQETGANGGQETAEVEKPSAKTETAQPDPETTAKDLAEEDAKQPEKPQDPNPTPVAKEVAAAQPEPVAAEPTGPPKPMTWASRAAAAAGPRPVVPLPKTATPPAQSQSRAPAPAAAAAAPAPAAATASQPAAPAPAAESQSKDASGWQTAGVDAKRQNRPQSTVAPPTDKEGTLGYVKYVTDKVQEADLKKALETHGELAYFDINRQKNCAFVEYKTPEGYHAALNSNPHTVNGEQIIVEQRRPKSNAFGGNNFGGSGRGGSQRGRGGFEGNRTGGQGGNRGNFSGQNRGRGAARGRGGAPQATNA